MEERIAWLAELPKPMGGVLHHTLNDNALISIGKIVSLWSMLDRQVDSQIGWFRASNAVPKDISDEPPRKEFNQRLNYLKKITEHALKNERPNALISYHRNIGKIANCKATRDALTHGSYNLQPAPGDIEVFYKQRTIHFSEVKLAKCAVQISECAGFFMNFDFWLQAPALQASLEKSHGRSPLECIVLTPNMHDNQQQS